MEKKIQFKRKVLSENDWLAAMIREKMSKHGIVAINLYSSRGSGKTHYLPMALLKRSGSPVLNGTDWTFGMNESGNWWLTKSPENHESL